MPSISTRLPFFVMTLAVCGCYGSRGRGDEVDSGFNGSDAIILTNEETGVDDTANDAGTNDTRCVANCPEVEWVNIPGGTFIMGSPDRTSFAYPQREVTVQTLKMSKTEITVAQYGMCVERGICGVPLHGGESHNWGKSGRDNHPVNAVTWYQAKEFAQWLGSRLPSEAEWEYAARGGGRNVIYPWGNEEATCERAVIIWDESENDCGNEKTAEVCSKPLGNTAQGLCDMAGNVWEWVEDDSHRNNIGAPSDGRAWIDSPRSNLRVLRGGSWNLMFDFCRTDSSYGDGPNHRDSEYGFRIVLDTK